MNQIGHPTHGRGLIHIGPGVFHRAHQALYTQRAMAAAGGDWRILAISPRTTSVADTLMHQDGRYTVVVRGAGGSHYETVQVHSGAIAAARDPAVAHAALLLPEVKVVSLTITEKAYHGDSLVVGMLVDALKERHTLGVQPFTLLSCDNLSGNGVFLRNVVLDRASKLDQKFHDWLAEHGRFPSTMVDRISPATTPELLAEVERETGWADQLPVETERFSQWVIEDDFVGDRPEWETSGAQLVKDVEPYERMKLRMLNGAHSLIAYAGYLAGFQYVRDAMADPMLARKVNQYMSAAAATLGPIEDVDPAAYQDDLLERFRNPYIAHETYQIAMDGSQKIPQRIFAPALDAASSSKDTSLFAFVTATWAHYAAGRTDSGDLIEVQDPRKDELAGLPTDPSARVSALFSLPNLVPAELAANKTFTDQTRAALTAIQEVGVLGALQEAVDA